MAACLYSWSNDVVPDVARDVAEIVCAEARKTPLVHEDHHVRIEKVGARYLVRLRGRGVDEEILVQSLEEVYGLAPRLIGEAPREVKIVTIEPPPRPRPPAASAMLDASRLWIGALGTVSFPRRAPGAGAVVSLVMPPKTIVAATADLHAWGSPPYALIVTSIGGRLRWPGEVGPYFQLGYSAGIATGSTAAGAVGTYLETGATFRPVAIGVRLAVIAAAGQDPPQPGFASLAVTLPL